MLVSPAFLHAAVVDCWRSACIESSGCIAKSLWKLTLFTGNFHEFQRVPGLVRLLLCEGLSARPSTTRTAMPPPLSKAAEVVPRHVHLRRR